MTDIPQLVTLSGRQESSVIKIINDLKSRPIDPEELALLRNIHKTSIMGHLGRGYAVLGTVFLQFCFFLSKWRFFVIELHRNNVQPYSSCR